MVEITEQEYKQYQLLRKIFIHANPENFEGTYFICGEGGTKDDLLLPEYIRVCPAHGVDASLTKLYKRQDRNEGETQCL